MNSGREVWKCTRCDTVHDFEEGEEPLAWFYCTMSVSPNDMSTNRCGEPYLEAPRIRGTLSVGQHRA